MHESNLFAILSLGITAAIILFLANYYTKKRKNKDNWVKVFSSSSVSQAEIVKGKLEHEGIIVVVINKRDSVYPTHGEVDVLVSNLEEDRAKEIINAIE